MNNTVLFFENKNDELLPDEFRHEDIRFAESFVQYILEQYTTSGDIATLFKAEFPFIKEKVLHWGGGYGPGYDHSYCLIFRKDS